MKICLYIFSHKTKIDLTFLFDCNVVRALEVFKGIVGCIFKCETTKIKLAISIKNGFLSKSCFVFFVFCDILSNTYVIQVFENF